MRPHLHGLSAHPTIPLRVTTFEGSNSCLSTRSGSSLQCARARRVHVTQSLRSTCDFRRAKSIPNSLPTSAAREKSGGPTHLVELVRWPVGTRYWIRRDGQKLPQVARSYGKSDRRTYPGLARLEDLSTGGVPAFVPLSAPLVTVSRQSRRPGAQCQLTVRVLGSSPGVPKRRRLLAHLQPFSNDLALLLSCRSSMQCLHFGKNIWQNVVGESPCHKARQSVFGNASWWFD